MFNWSILSNEMWNHLWENVKLRWRIHISRIKGQNLAFLILRDRKWLMQIVLEDPKEIEKLQWMLLWTVILAEWKIVEVPKWKFKYEMQNWKITIIEPIKNPSPIDISKPEINVDWETIHENKIVYLRHPKQMQIFRIAHKIEKYIRKFFDENDFTQINTPKIIWFPTEWWAEVFEFPYFEKTAYLAQSPQFYKQIMCWVFERVFEIWRAYRAEKSHTSRHTTEILMLDMEMAFIDSFDDVLQMAENFINNTINNLRKDKEAILLFEKLWINKPLLPEKFPKITMDEIHNLYFEKKWIDFRGERDLAPEEEKFIWEYFKNKNNSDFVFVDWFPWSDAKFYHKQNSNNPERADRADLLFKWLEISTITRRETNYNKIIEQIKSNWYDPKNPWLKHFLDAFKYWMPPQWWFWFWITRFIEKILWLNSVKEAELFPRDVNRLTP